MRVTKMVSSATTMVIFVFLVVFCATFEVCSADTNQQSADQFGSSVVFPVTGNVYPKGHYHVTLNIGQPPKPYYLDIDTGSDLTWLQCDAPCTKCTPAPHSLYKPNKDILKCEDPLCDSMHWPGSINCESPEEQCDYEIEYADQGSSLGVLVKDYFQLSFTTNPNPTVPHLAFGCGYNQEVPDSIHAPYTDGVLGLGEGKSSILTQLRDLGLLRNVVGQCLSTNGGGFLFFGHHLVPSSGIVWMPLLRNSLQKHYTLGPADLFYRGKAIGVKGLPLVVDSGSTYSYFNTKAYGAILSMVKRDLSKENELEETAEDKTLSVCWKGKKPFESIHQAKNYFKPLVLNFPQAKKTNLEMPPEAYLIISEHGNICLGILNGTEVGLGNVNIIGDISMQDKMVIYDNEKKQIGWGTANCDRLPNTEGDYRGSFSQQSNLRFPEGHEDATYGTWEDQ